MGGIEATGKLDSIEIARVCLVSMCLFKSTR